VRPKTSPCGGPPPNCGLATHEPAQNAVRDSNRRWVSTSIVMMTYSAIAGSWPNIEPVTALIFSGTLAFAAVKELLADGGL